MKSYTDIEQSKKLAEILPLESADHHYVRKTCDFMGNPIDGEWSQPKYGNPNSKYANYLVQNFTTYETIPCWSLSALLDILPHRIDVRYDLVLGKLSDDKGWYVVYDDVDHFARFYVTHSDLIDACVEMIVKLKEKDLL